MNTIKEEINKAIKSHINWKKELRKTIISGKLDTPVDIIEKDTECEFGKWLLTSKNLVKVKTTLPYNEIVILHLEFHKLAGKIASLAVAGKKDAAKKLMVHGGSYSSLSEKLINALHAWDFNNK